MSSEDALFQVADAVDALSTRRTMLERFAAASLHNLNSAVPPDVAAHLAWTRALAMLAWLDEHAAEVEAATQHPEK